MTDKEFILEFERITRDFDNAQVELRRTWSIRFLKQRKLFKIMEATNFDMDMLGKKAATYARRFK